VDCLVLSFILDDYHEEEVKGEKRVVLRFKPLLAPIKVAILPLVRNRKPLVNKAREIFKILSAEIATFYDEGGSIGRRYRRQDEIGTPFCVTIDFDTLKDDTVTMRDRDTMRQERVKIQDLVDLVNDKMTN